MKEKHLENVATRIPPSLKLKIVKYAKSEYMSESAVFRKALVAFFKNKHDKLVTK